MWLFTNWKKKSHLEQVTYFMHIQMYGLELIGN